jgi:hypothetical protein
MSNKGSNKWKDALLKTSLPLEFLVAEKLDSKQFSVSGEYSFVRKNEQNLDTEFSVDLRASNYLMKRKDDYWGDLNLLVECKYNYPGVKWVFAPHPSNSTIVTGVINVLDDLCTRRVANLKVLNGLDKGLEYCVKGIELHESDANTQSIQRGLYQLRCAAIQCAADIVRNQIMTGHDEDLEIGFICPILVTTASLHLLRSNVRLEEFQNASSMEEISKPADALIVYKPLGPVMRAFARQVTADLYKIFPETKERLKSAAEVMGKAETYKVLGVTWDLDRSIRSAGERVLVVNFDALDNVVKKIRRLVIRSGLSLKRIGILKFDADKRIGLIEPVAKAV